MKKVLSVILILAVCVPFLTACGGSGDSAVVGEWKPSKIETGGQTIDVKDYESMLGSALDMSFEFKSDGKFSASAMGVKSEGTYEVNGDEVKMTFDGNTQTLKIDGDTLVLDQGGAGKMIFVKK